MSKATIIIFLLVIALAYISFMIMKNRNRPKLSSAVKNKFEVGPSKRLPVFPLSSQSVTNDDTTTVLGSPQRLYMLFNNEKDNKSYAHYFQIKNKLIRQLDVIDIGAMYEEEEKAYALVILYKQDKICIVSNYGTDNSSYKIVENNVKKIKQITTLGKNIYGLTSEGKVVVLSPRTFQWRTVLDDKGKSLDNVSWISSNTSNILIDNRLFEANTTDRAKLTFVNLVNVPHGHIRYLGRNIHDYADLNTVTGQVKIYINGILSHTQQHVADVTFGHTVLVVQRGDDNFVKTKFLFGEQMLISRSSLNEFNTTLTNTSVKIE